MSGIVCIVVGIAIAFIAYFTLHDIASDKDLIYIVAPILAIFFIVGISNLIEANQELKKLKQRQAAPVTINTKFNEVRVQHVDDGPTHYYVITSWINPNNNKIYLFKSKEVDYSANDIIKRNGIVEFPVTYEAGNINNYEVDLSRLENNL